MSLLLVLLLGVTFACDQPYEEIMGIKIGCPLENKENYQEELLFEELDENKEPIASIYHYVDIQDPDLYFSSRNQIIVINGIVEYVEINNISDPQDIVAELDAKWDEQIKTNECEIRWITDEDYCNNPELDIYIWNPSNEVVHSAILKYGVRSYQLKVISELYKELSDLINSAI